MIIVSVIVCTYKRQEYIIKALSSLINQTAKSSEYEIIVVNNNSPDNTHQLCEDFIRKYDKDFSLQYVIEYNQGLSFARNRGYEISRGKYIAYMDDDGVARDDYICSIIEAFQIYQDYSALGGKVLPIFENGKKPKWLSKYLNGIVSKVDMGETPGTFKKKYPVGCNMAFRREVLEELGTFNTDLTIRSDDKYMFYKLKENKKKILYAPSIIVDHHIDNYRLEPGYLKNQSFQIGYGERLRLKDCGFVSNLAKLLEYLVKVVVSIILAFVFLIKGEPKKGEYLIKIIFNTLLGYLFVKPKA